MNSIENSTEQEIQAVFNQSKNILINMDTRTDFDALCSSIVLDKYLVSLGKKTRVIHAEKINQAYRKYFSVDAVDTETDISRVDLKNYDLVVLLDSGTEEHISLDENFKVPSGIKSINIDHHITNNMFGQLNYVYRLGSCCSVLYKFFKEIDFLIPLEYLDILVIGLLKDTGFFKFDTTTPEDFRIAGEMVERGVRVSDTIAKLTSYETIDQLRYKELVYRNLKVDFEKKYAYSTITLDELSAENINMDKVTVRHSNLLKYLVGVDFSFVIAEVEANQKCYELSFRSKVVEVDVSKMAEMFGGAGHKTAAGAKLYGVDTIEEALSHVLDVLNL